MFLFSNTLSKETIVFYLTNQGRIQDLSEGALDLFRNKIIQI